MKRRILRIYEYMKQFKKGDKKYLNFTDFEDVPSLENFLKTYVLNNNVSFKTYLDGSIDVVDISGICKGYEIYPLGVKNIKACDFYLYVDCDIDTPNYIKEELIKNEGESFFLDDERYKHGILAILKGKMSLPYSIFRPIFGKRFTQYNIEITSNKIYSKEDPYGEEDWTDEKN